MNHTLVRAALPILVSCLSLPLALSACSPGARTAPRDDTAGQETVSDLSSDPAACYESEILALREALLREKADRYASDAAHAAEIEALKAALSAGASAGAAAGASAGASARDSQPVSAGTQPADAAERASRREPTPLSEPAEPPAPAAVLDFTVQGGEVAVTRCTLRTGGSGAVTIPDAVGGLPVTRIADGAFRDTAVTAVTLPGTLTEIGWFAFSGCALLETVTLPASVSAIGYGAFDGCPLLTVDVQPYTYAAAWAHSFGIPTVKAAP